MAAPQGPLQALLPQSGGWARGAQAPGWQPRLTPQRQQGRCEAPRGTKRSSSAPHTCTALGATQESEDGGQHADQQGPQAIRQAGRQDTDTRSGQALEQARHRPGVEGEREPQAERNRQDPHPGLCLGLLESAWPPQIQGLRPGQGTGKDTELS